MNKVSIYTVHYNRPEFISLQYSQLKKHCIDNFEYIVINNGKDIDIKNEIKQTCNSLGIKNIECIHSIVDPRIHMCSHDHIMCLENIFKEYVCKDTSDIRAVIDNDVIAYRSFTFFDILKDADMAGMYLEAYIPYSASIFTIFGKTVDLNGFEYNGKFGDSGSGTGILIRDRGYKINWINHTAPVREHESKYIFKNKKLGSLEYNNDWGIQFLSEYFIHFYRGTGWDNGDPFFYTKKYEFFTHIIQNIDLYEPLLDNNVHYPQAHMDQWIYKERYNLYKYEKLSNNID